MEWLYGVLGGFVIGTIATYYGNKTLDRLHGVGSKLLQRSRHRRFEQAWDTYKSLSAGLELVQPDWKHGLFTPEEVVLTLGPDFDLPNEIALEIREVHRAEWEQSNQKDNIQIGLSGVDPLHLTDEIGATVPHQLRLIGHKYHYFDFLATNRTLLGGSTAEEQLLAKYILERHSLQPQPAFPNPLSVGLTLFCEDGECLVLTRRTKQASSGGTWFGNAIFNAVGENVNPRDVSGYFDGADRLSPWETARRGLAEEMGLTHSDIDESELVLHSFAWDTRILDYKFFGYAKSPLLRAEIQQRWTFAPDRHESWSLDFVDVKSQRQRAQLIRDLVAHKQDWSSEALLCTVRSMLHLFHDLPDNLASAASRQH